MNSQRVKDKDGKLPYEPELILERWGQYVEQCSNYMQARVCRAPSLLVRAPILSEIFGVQRGPA